MESPIFLTLSVLISVLILLIIMSVVLVSPSPPPILPPPISQLKYSPTTSISIVIPSITPSISDLIDYAKTWGYNIDKVSNVSNINPLEDSFQYDYIFYINDNIDSINLSKDLGHIISMMGNSLYAYFLNSKSLIIKVDTNSRYTYEKSLEWIQNDTVHLLDSSEDILNIVVETGFPYRTQNGIILSKDYLDEIINSKPLPFKDIVVIQSSIKPRMKSSNQDSKIPKVIYQTFETKALPSRFIDAINTWLIRNPEYKYRYYDAGDRRQFIEKYFEQRVLKAYDKLIPGAYKADFWRYCIIYIKGGVYVDIKMGAKVPLKNIIDVGTDMLFVNDEPEGMLYNAFFASTPRNPLLFDVIMKIVNNIETEFYGMSPLFPTGPVPMGSVIIPALGYNDKIPDGKLTTSSGIVQIYSFHHIHGDARLLHYIGSDPDNAIIRVRNTPNTHDQDFLLSITGVPNYGVLWNDRKIYH